MARAGEVTVDGHIVGDIDIEIFEEESLMPDGSFTAHDAGGEAMGQGGPPSFRKGIGPGRHAHEKSRHPTFRKGIHTRTEHPPTFRRGIGPGSEQHGSAPGGGTFPTIKNGAAASSPKSGTGPGGGTFPKITKSGEGEIDRAHHRAFLEAHPATKDKILAIMAGEQGESPRGTQAIAEETMNRADVRGQDLAEATKIHGMEPGGYSAGYKPGALNNPKWRAVLEDSLEKALKGSNVNNWATDNSSAGLAASEAKGGEFTSTGDQITGESFWTRNLERAAHAAWKAKQSGRTDTTNGPSSAGIARQPRTDRDVVTGTAPGVNRAAAGGGGNANFPVASGVNTSRIDPEIIDRLNQMNKDAPAGSKFEVISGYRPPTRADARALGMDEHSSQEDIWERFTRSGQYAGRDPSTYHRPAMAARPGHSQHQRGEAVDVSDPSGWFHAHAGEYGLANLAGDYPHFYKSGTPQRAVATSPPPQPPQTRASPVSSSSANDTLLFLRGVRTTPEVEANARKYAERQKLKFEATEGLGGYSNSHLSAEQQRLAVERLKRGGVAEVFGFSAGGYTAGRIRKAFPGVKFTITGSPGVEGDIERKGVNHMDLPGAMVED
jgi:hypothetical protein